MKKDYRQLERIVRGFSNHRRIQILELIYQNINPELSLTDIAEKLHINFKTAGEHVRRLVIAGLVLKRNQGATVRHKISPRGIVILKFLRTLE